MTPEQLNDMRRLAACLKFAAVWAVSASAYDYVLGESTGRSMVMSTIIAAPWMLDWVRIAFLEEEEE